MQRRPGMTGATRLVGLLAVSLCLLGTGRAASAQPRSPCVVRAEITGVVTSGTADYVEDAIVRAAGCEAVLIVLDTPGGAIEATRRVVRALLASPVPVITYVAPGGARAGSAGMFLLLAGHVAAMAPGSNVGAAHPVTGLGGDPEEMGAQMARKIESDAAAFARALAQERGRNADWAEGAVRRSLAAAAEEARALGVIDLVADSDEALFAMLDGRTLVFEGSVRRLSLASSAVTTHPMSVAQRARSILAHPTLLWILLALGALGVMIEIARPGRVVPGTVGALALALAALGLDLLPVDVGGVVLVAVGAAVMVTELFVPSFGALGFAGFAVAAFGALLLIDGADPAFFAVPTLRLAFGAVIPLGALLAAAAAWLGLHHRRMRARRARTDTKGAQHAA